MPTDLLAFNADILEKRQIEFAYSGGQYGTPRKAMNELVQTTILGEGWKEAIGGPIISNTGTVRVYKCIAAGKGAYGRQSEATA